MAKYITGGTRGFIGTSAAAKTLSEYKADLNPGTEILEVEDFGQFGDTANEVTGTAVGDRRVQKFKGSLNAGTIALVCFKDNQDPGQLALKAAQKSDLDFNFHVVLNDKPTAAGAPTEFYFRGKVMSSSDNVGNVDNLTRTTFNIGINSEILELPSSTTART
ncbi:phage tail tube protein [Aureimonas ureilytica]|uniref:phage tail tube protein n=1 Tax=Aureimonas ureilytica TaxID=401562 RepID=UPI003CF4F595